MKNTCVFIISSPKTRQTTAVMASVIYVALRPHVQRSVYSCNSLTKQTTAVTASMIYVAWCNSLLRPHVRRSVYSCNTLNTGYHVARWSLCSQHPLSPVAHCQVIWKQCLHVCTKHRAVIAWYRASKYFWILLLNMTPERRDREANTLDQSFL